ELVEHGLSLSSIATARERLVQLICAEQPFACRGLLTDGQRICARIEDDRSPIDLVADGHISDPERLSPLVLRGVAFRCAARMADRVATAWTPTPGVTLDPEIQVGAPCLSGTRIPTWTMRSRVEDGETAQQLQRDFDYLPQEAVDAALAFEARLRELDG